MSVQVETRDGVSTFRPGDEVAGTVRWDLDRPPKSVAVRLFWYTEGKGNRDRGIVADLDLADPAATDRRPFRFVLPAGPWSFVGELITLVWAIEAVVEPGDHAARIEIAVSPTGRPIRLAGTPGAVAAG